MVQFAEVELGARPEFGEELLTIHRRAEPGPTARSLLVLVHGLQGDGFDTWTQLLQSPHLRGQSIDVGLVNYASGTKRFWRLPEAAPGAVSRALASELAQLDYARIVLVGHSMGGLVVKDSLRRLFHMEGDDHSSSRKVRGIVSIATPHTGSGAARLLSVVRLTKDYRVLRRHSELQREIDDFFATHVYNQLEGRGAQTLHVPVFGGSARRDYVVPTMGAELGLPAAQKKQLSGSHSGVLRHESTHQWVMDCVARSLDSSGSRALARASGVPLLTEFAGSASHPPWERIYHLALEAFERRHRMAVRDVTGTGSGATDLLVRILDAGPSSEMHALLGLVGGDVDRQVDQQHPMALGVCAVGLGHQTTRTILHKHFDAPKSRWLVGVEGDDDLPQAVEQFLDLTRRSLDIGRFPARRALVDEGGEL